MSTAWLIVGSPGHGVVLLAEQLTAQLDPGDVVVRAGTVGELLGPDVRWDGWVNAHVHFTDQLFGPDCAAAAAAYQALATRLADRGVALGVTLHDLPIDPDDPARYRRRADAYAAVIAATTGAVIVSSAHEATLMRAFAPTAPVAIPLPIDPSPTAAASPGPQPVSAADVTEVSILGFLYPGKGHSAAIEALAVLPGPVGLSVLGRVADGHAELADRLRARAADLGRRFTVTGWIAQDELITRLRSPQIPLVGHERLSASGSIGSWLAAGRRPLVPDVAYVRELADRLPGSVLPYPPTPPGLGTALARAYRDPASTWLDPGVELGPSTAEVRTAYRNAVITGSIR